MMVVLEFLQMHVMIRDNHVFHNYVGKLVRKFQESGSGANKNRALKNGVRREQLKLVFGSQYNGSNRLMNIIQV